MLDALLKMRNKMKMSTITIDRTSKLYITTLRFDNSSCELSHWSNCRTKSCMCKNAESFSSKFILSRLLCTAEYLYLESSYSREDKNVQSLFILMISIFTHVNMHNTHHITSLLQHVQLLAMI